MSAVLEVEHLTMRFGGLAAVSDVSFTAERGTITAIIGPNGAGKTTLFNCITGFYRPRVGRIRMTRENGRQHLLERLESHRIARAGVVRTFQTGRLFPRMSVLENLIVAQHAVLAHASRWSVAGLLALPAYRRAERAALDRALYWLDETALTARANDPAGTLPRGLQRRVELARAMCAGPELLCLDEPAAGLNARETEELKALLRDINRTHRLSILLIEHDVNLVMDISDRVVVLDHGACIANGAPDSVRNDARVIAAYLGASDLPAMRGGRG